MYFQKFYNFHKKNFVTHLIFTTKRQILWLGSKFRRPQKTVVPTYQSLTLISELMDMVDHFCCTTSLAVTKTSSTVTYSLVYNNKEDSEDEDISSLWSEYLS